MKSSIRGGNVFQKHPRACGKRPHTRQNAFYSEGISKKKCADTSRLHNQRRHDESCIEGALQTMSFQSKCTTQTHRTHACIYSTPSTNTHANAGEKKKNTQQLWQPNKAGQELNIIPRMKRKRKKGGVGGGGENCLVWIGCWHLAYR